LTDDERQQVADAIDQLAKMGFSIPKGTNA
jgi:hypothetical protein